MTPHKTLGTVAALFTVAMGVVFAAGCSDDGDRDTSPFALSAQAISDSIEVSTAIGTNVADGLSIPDADLYMAQFHPTALVTDPINPSLMPDVLGFYGGFGRAGLLCESWPLDDVYVNVGGALTSGSCEGYYRNLPDSAELPQSGRILRHLPISDGLATGLAHLNEISFVTDHPVKFVRVIGFSRWWAADVLEDAAQAEEFLDRLQSAWDSRDPEEMAALYADEGTRHDGFAADRQGRQQIADWYALLFRSYPSIEMTITESYASGLGPGALHALTMTTADGEACTMNLGTVWNLNDDGLIDDEYVYYDPDTVLACGWAADS